jgi:ATP-dependent RNA helicase RhlE
VEKNNKKNLLIHLLKESSYGSILVFTRTKHGADKVVKELNGVGISAEAIHGNKSQNARQRALSNFKSKVTRVLVATDIAARGIDIDDLPLVINYELPNEPETYVHRIGRTGRAGATGMALSFCDQEERAYLKLIQKLINKTLTVQDKHPFLPQDPRFFMDTVAPSKSPNDRRPSKNSSRRGGNHRPMNSSSRREEEKKPWFRKR